MDKHSAQGQSRSNVFRDERYIRQATCVTSCRVWMWKVAVATKILE